MSDLRADIKKEEPGLDVEFIQLLSDMIGDLSNQPETVVALTANGHPVD